MMSSRGRHFRALVPAIAFFICGCGGSSGQQHEQARQTLQSWIKAVDLAEHHRADGRVPQLFIPQLLKEADKGLAEEREQIRGQRDLESLAQQLEAKIREARARPQ